MYSTTYNSNNLSSSQVNHFLGTPLTLRPKKQIKVRIVAPKKVPTQAVADVLYKYTDSHTGKEVGLSKAQLLKLGREFIPFTRESDCLFTKIFWEKRGITREVVKDWCKREPEFKLFFDIGAEIIKGSRERLALNDIVYLRNTISLYLPEYKEHDAEMLGLKAKIRFMI
jgi:hypothetical protein